MTTHWANRSVAHHCTFSAEIFARETLIRQRLPQIQEPSIQTGACIAAAEFAKVRSDHANHCPSCAALEDSRLAVAA